MIEKCDCERKYCRYHLNDGNCTCTTCSDMIDLMIRTIKQFPMNFTHIQLKNDLCKMVEKLTGLTERDIRNK